MVNIRPVEKDDQDFWFSLDHHLSELEFDNKVRDQRGYVLTESGVPIGLLRYNLFWDSIPFCTMLYIDPHFQQKGYGSMLMKFWEDEMRTRGDDMVLVSTQADESTQHFYRKIGYQDCGGLVMNIPGHEQPMEIFLVKDLQRSQI